IEWGHPMPAAFHACMRGGRSVRERGVALRGSWASCRRSALPAATDGSTRSTAVLGAALFGHDRAGERLHLAAREPATLAAARWHATLPAHVRPAVRGIAEQVDLLATAAHDLIGLAGLAVAVVIEAAVAAVLREMTALSGTRFGVGVVAIE